MKLTRKDAVIAGGCFVMLFTALLVYWPAMHGDFVWDDVINIRGNPVLSSPTGLLEIWTASDDAVYDFYPLTWTTWWLEWQAWRKDTFGYHLVNVLIHAGTAGLLWRVLARLSVPGAFFAAMLFLVHPVNVESVAWISERKNTLSMLMLAASLALYLDAESEGPHRRRFYWASVVFFALALLAKPSVVLLPAVLLLVAWWRRGTLKRSDFWKVIPFGVLSAVISVVTILVHHSRGIENSVVRSDGFLARLAGAGWCVWFYLGKLLWPADIKFLYPRWKIDPAAPSHWLPLAALVGAFSLLFVLRRRIGRGPVVVLACYVALLFPVLGFVDIYFFRYSFVADHWQYPACLVVFALVASIGVMAFRKAGEMGHKTGGVVAFAIVGMLSVQSWREAHHYQSEAALWAAAFEANPTAPMAVSNYAATNLSPQKRYDEARAVFRRAIELDPQYSEPYLAIGRTYQDEKNMVEAIAWYRRALDLPSGWKDPRILLGDVYRDQGDAATALSWYEQALTRNERCQEFWFVMPGLYETVGNVPAALERYQANVDANPEEMEQWFRLGVALLRYDRKEEGRAALRKAADLSRDAVEINSMGLRLHAVRHFDEGAEMFFAAIRKDPEYGPAYNKLGECLESLGRLDQAAEAYERAIQVQPGFREAIANRDRLLATPAQTRPAA